MTVPTPREPSAALHAWAIALAGATLVLIYVGGLVTSTGSGLAVPDWPLSFGQVFPPMVGGILYEHGHRMVAAAVGLMTVVLAAWTWTTRAGAAVRWLALAAVVTVVAQGVLGGLTVLWLLPPAVSIGHACLAQAFLCLTVALAVLTGPDHARARMARGAVRTRPALRALSLGAVAAVYLQIVLGAVMRHTGAGLAIPDFPLAFGGLVPPLAAPGVAVHFAHRCGAVVVVLMVGWALAHVRRHYADAPALARPARVAGVVVALQLTLGALVIWTGKAVVPTTAHVAGGAALLAACLVLALRAHRLRVDEVAARAPALAREGVLA